MTAPNSLPKTKEEWEIQYLMLECERSMYQTQHLQNEQTWWEHSNRHARVYDFTTAVGPQSTALLIDALGRWQRQSSDDIEIVFHSPGGDVFSGLGLYDYIQTVKKDCHVTTTCCGYAASMGGVLLQAGHHRIMTKNSYMMIHEVSSDMWGKTAELFDQAELCKRLENQCNAILASRSKLTAAQINDKSARKDWWLNATEAKRHGFVDEVR